MKKDDEIVDDVRRIISEITTQIPKVETLVLMWVDEEGSHERVVGRKHEVLGLALHLLQKAKRIDLAEIEADMTDAENR